MKILVTGSSGMLMRLAIPKLRERHEVIGVDVVGGPLTDVTADLCGPSAPEYLKSAFSRVDGVLHAAALVIGAKGIEDKQSEALFTNVRSTLAVAEAISASPHLQRVAFLSSSCVYDNGVPPVPEDDVETLAPPASGYGFSKLVGEKLLKAATKSIGAPLTIWRPFNLVAVAERPKVARGHAHVIPDLIHRIVELRENPLGLYGGGPQIRCFTWAAEAADSIARWSFDTRTADRTINLGNPTPTKIRDLAHAIYAKAAARGLLGTAPADLVIAPLATPKTDVPVHLPYTATAEELIGWKTNVGLDQMLDAYFDDWFAAPRSAA